MNKKRVISYVMAAALLVGGTFAGTKALFTDSVDAVGEVTISTGDVDVEIASAGEWNLKRNGEEENTGTPVDGKTADFDNLKTGDVLTKTVTVTNAGTLTALVNLSQKSNSEIELPEGIKYSVEVLKDESPVEKVDEITMAPGSNLVVNLKLEVKGGGKHNDKVETTLNSDEQEKTIINLKDSVILNATQQNPGTK